MPDGLQKFFEFLYEFWRGGGWLSTGVWVAITWIFFLVYFQLREGVHPRWAQATLLLATTVWVIVSKNPKIYYMPEVLRFRRWVGRHTERVVTVVRSLIF